MHVKAILAWSRNKSHIYTWKLCITVCLCHWFSFLAQWPKSGCWIRCYANRDQEVLVLAISTRVTDDREGNSSDKQKQSYKGSNYIIW